jgi:hypothetical protein
MSRIEARQRVRRIEVERRDLLDVQRRLVRMLRGYPSRPETWASIGLLLGISAQAAQQRFRGHVS